MVAVLWGDFGGLAMLGIRVIGVPWIGSIGFSEISWCGGFCVDPLQDRVDFVLRELARGGHLQRLVSDRCGHQAVFRVAANDGRATFAAL